MGGILRLPPLYFTTDEHGNVIYESSKLADRVFKSLPIARHVMTIKRFRKARSAAQNNYTWGVVYDILSKETGFTPEEVHQVYGEMFLSYEKDGHTFVKSTTKLTTVEMEDYLSKVRQHASQFFHCYIPLPNENHWLDV